MALLLAIETSTKVCSVALQQDGKVLGLAELYLEKSHGEQLQILVSHICKQSGFSLQDLDGVAVSKGPGSYTGLRIGVSTAKGLCYALDKPLLAINTLEALALQAAPWAKSDTLLCPMLDARRMEVYCAVFDSQMQEVLPTEAKILDEKAFEELLERQEVLFIGDAVGKTKALLAHQAKARFVENIYPSAKQIALLAEVRYQAQAFEDTAYFEPYYLKDFIGAQAKPKT